MLVRSPLGLKVPLANAVRKIWAREDKQLHCREFIIFVSARTRCVHNISNVP
jgi:hypothetical protein